MGVRQANRFLSGPDREHRAGHLRARQQGDRFGLAIGLRAHRHGRRRQGRQARIVLSRILRKGDHDHCTHAFVFGPDGKLYFNFGNEVKELRRPKGGLLALPLHGPVPKHEAETVVDLAGNRSRRQGQALPPGHGLSLQPRRLARSRRSAGTSATTTKCASIPSARSGRSRQRRRRQRGVRINYVMEFGNFGYQDEMTGAGWSVDWKNAQAKRRAKNCAPPSTGTVRSRRRANLHHDRRRLAHRHPASMKASCCPSLSRPGDSLRCRAERCPRLSGRETTAPATARRMTNVLWGGDNWFRPADVCVAPDGSLFVADWYDAGRRRPQHGRPRARNHDRPRLSRRATRDTNPPCPSSI